MSFKDIAVQFDSIKQSQQADKIKARSKTTLEWYEAIGLMLDDEAYSYCHKFLQSISEYIETKEIISDGQIQGVQNIIDGHRDFSSGSPF